MKVTVTGERLFTRNFLLVWATAFTIFSSFQVFLPILPLYILSVGGTESQIGLVVGMASLSAVILRTWVGREADRRGKRTILLWGGPWPSWSPRLFMRWLPA